LTPGPLPGSGRPLASLSLSRHCPVSPLVRRTIFQFLGIQVFSASKQAAVFSSLKKDEGRLAYIHTTSSSLSLSVSKILYCSCAFRKNFLGRKDMAFLFCQEENGRTVERCLMPWPFAKFIDEFRHVFLPRGLTGEGLVFKGRYKSKGAIFVWRAKKFFSIIQERIF
jgi:hypothetical protein